jgi:plastocyanin
MRAHARLFPVVLLLAAGSALGVDHPVAVGGAGLTFSPANFSINQGDTVTFTNAGGFHNVHATSGPTLFQCSVNCTTTNTPNSTAWSDTISFPTAGTVNFQCDQHAGFGMVGTITVNPVVPVRLQSFEVD